ncbi:MAG: hypothetical protein MJ108_09280 [Saccharofermentans sp.]|nr:hypothetical protein [Saccharofermentans sp.]
MIAALTASLVAASVLCTGCNKADGGVATIQADQEDTEAQARALIATGEEEYALALECRDNLKYDEAKEHCDLAVEAYESVYKLDSSLMSEFSFTSVDANNMKYYIDQSYYPNTELIRLDKVTGDKYFSYAQQMASNTRDKRCDDYNYTSISEDSAEIALDKYIEYLSDLDSVTDLHVSDFTTNQIAGFNYKGKKIEIMWYENMLTVMIPADI